MAFLRKRDPLDAEAVELSLHELARIRVPATFDLQRGIWNYQGWSPNLPGRYPLVEPEDAVDPEKVTFALSIDPQVDPGGHTRDDGELLVTLFRNDPGPLEPAAYFQQLYGSAHPVDRLYGGQQPDGRMMFSGEGHYFASAMVVHSERRIAGFLKVNEGEEADTLRKLVAILDSVSVEEEAGAGKLERHFAAVDAFPERVRKQTANHLRLSNESLEANGFPPVTPGRASHHGREVFALMEEPHKAGVNEAWLQLLGPVIAVSLKEGLWLRQKLDDRGEMSGLVFLEWRVETGAWEVTGGQLTPEAYRALAVPTAALDPAEIHIYYMARWAVHSAPWTGECFTRHRQDFAEAASRIDNLRSYYRKTRSRGLTWLPVPEGSSRPVAAPAILPPLSPVRRVRKWGYKDRDSRLAIECDFDEAQPFREDLAWVRRGDRWMAINAEGVVVFELEVDGVEIAWPFSNGWACFRAELYNFVDRDGNLMRYHALGQEFVAAESYRGPYARVTDAEGREGWIDGKGEWAAEDAVRRWRLQMRDWIVAGTPEIGLYYTDVTGRITINAPAKAALARPFQDNLAAFWTRDAGFGFMDRAARVVIPPQFARAEDFSEGYAAVCPSASMMLWTYIDKAGRPIAAPEFSEAGPFTGGLALVRKNLYYYIDGEGRLQVPPELGT